MKAFHNDPELKKSVLNQILIHQEADSFTQKIYWDPDSQKGCAVGCLTHDVHGGHHLYPSLWGIPEQLAYLEDAIFEGLSIDQAKQWPYQFMSAIPVGANLGLVFPGFVLWLLSDDQYGIKQYSQEKIIDEICAAYQDVLSNKAVSDEHWKKLEDKALSCYDQVFSVRAPVGLAAQVVQAAREAFGCYYKSEKLWYQAASRKLLELIHNQT